MYTTVAAAISDTLTITTSTVEVNTKDSGGFRDLFPAGSIKGIDIAAQWQFTDTTDQQRVRAIAMLSDPSANFRILDGSGMEFEGRFQLTQYEAAGETEGFVQVNISLSSTGVILLQAES